jgi:HEAT repeat protein
VRVLVGRTEVITPEMEDAVKREVSMLSDSSPKVREQASLAIQKLGRFYEPILKRIVDDERDETVRARIRRLLETSQGDTINQWE